MAHLFYCSSLKDCCTLLPDSHCLENRCFIYFKAGAESGLCHSLLTRSGNPHLVTLPSLQMRTQFIFTVKYAAAINMLICVSLTPVTRVYDQKLYFRVTRFMYLQSTENLCSKSAVPIYIAINNLRKLVFPKIFINTYQVFQSYQFILICNWHCADYQFNIYLEFFL